MRNILLFPAISLSIGVGKDFGMNNGGSGLPVVSMNFPFPFAEELTANLFRPYSKPEHFLFGFRDEGGKVIEVSLYFLAQLNNSISLPLITKQLGSLPTSPTFYLIGADADIGRTAVDNFLQHKLRMGKYYVVCGYNFAGAGQITVVVGDWKVELVKIHSPKEVHRQIWEKIME